MSLNKVYLPQGTGTRRSDQRTQMIQSYRNPSDQAWNQQNNRSQKEMTQHERKRLTPGRKRATFDPKKEVKLFQ
eukprot:4249043-Pyramimonas_sp.AAC.1